MGISAGPAGGDDDVPISDINVVPFTDVMLVLVIIFLIAVPVAIQTIPIALPKVRYEVTTTKPENVSLTVRNGAGGACEVYWNMTRVTQKDLLDRAVRKLEDQIKAVGGVQNITEENMPEAHIRGDVNTQYKCIGAAIITMQQAGFQRVGFISEPPPLAGVRAEVGVAAMAMQTTGSNTDAEPMIDINTTPLIDVMLVLLIMLIITIPVQTHAVKLDLPVNQPNQPPPPIDPIKNKVVVTAQGQTLWNGSPVTKPQLRAYLDATQQMTPVPELLLQPEASAKYVLVDEVLAVTKQARVQKMGFVGNEYYTQVF